MPGQSSSLKELPHVHHVVLEALDFSRGRVHSPEVSEWSARRLLASSNPYEVADGIRAIVSTYFYEEDKTGFDQTLAKGIEQFLKTATFEEMRKAFKWFIKGNKKAIQNLKSFGETPAR